MRFSCFGNATLFSRTSKTLNPLVFSGVRVTRTLVLYVCFVDRCLSFCPFSLEEIAPHWEKTMCYSCYGLPQVDYK
jgi:hypothetical protein